VLIFLFIFYFFTRLINLNSLPVFNDEAIYIDWSYKALNIPGLEFYSLYDSKQPLILWLFGIFQKLFEDPLLASRLVSVLIGFLTVLGINQLAKIIFQKKKLVLAPYIYIITPIFLFFDRQALMESAVFCFGIYLYLVFLKFRKNSKLLFSILLGIIIGVGLYIKSSIILYVMGLLPLLIQDIRKNNDEENFKLYQKLFLVVVSMMVVALPLFTQKLFWKTFNSNDRFILTISDIISLPFEIWTKNLYAFVSVSSIYISPFLIFILILMFFKNRKLGYKIKDFFIYFGSVVFLAILLTRGLNVRYVMPLLFGFPILLEYFVIEYQFKTKLLNGLFALIFIPSIFLSFILIYNYELYFQVLNQFTQYSQRNEYLVSWTSGKAVQEAVAYIKNEMLEENIPLNIGIRTDAGNPENTILYSFNDTPNVKVSYLDERIFKNIADFDCLKSDQKFIFVSRDMHMGQTDKLWQEKVRFYNYENQNYVAIHEQREDCQGNILELK
jgi:4-amino-4-deoxy-L-arabinose transferase-like glycosyltransferase